MDSVSYLEEYCALCGHNPSLHSGDDDVNGEDEDENKIPHDRRGRRQRSRHWFCVTCYDQTDVTLENLHEYECKAAYDRDSPSDREYEVLELIRKEKENEERKAHSKLMRKLFTLRLRYEILERDGHRCRSCGQGPEDDVKIEVDHIIPVAEGGTNHRDNLRAACFDCNRGKGALVRKPSKPVKTKRRIEEPFEFPIPF